MNKPISSWKYRIVQAGLTQAQFGEIVGIKQSHVSLLCTGKMKPKDVTYNKIENALKELGV